MIASLYASNNSLLLLGSSGNCVNQATSAASSCGSLGVNALL
jgi:hypothetical protein